MKKILFSLVLALLIGCTAKPEPVTKFMGVKLGETKDQVQYALGFPTAIYKEEPAPKEFAQQSGSTTFYALGDPNDIKVVGALNKYDAWEYDLGTYSSTVTFGTKSGVVETVSCMIPSKRNESDSGKCSVNGVKLKDSEESVVKRLGNPTEEKLSLGVKRMYYDKLNLVVLLEKQAVYMLMMSRDAGK